MRKVLIMFLTTLLIKILAVYANAQDSSSVPPENYQPTLTEEKYGAATALLIQDVYPWSSNSNVQALQELGISYDIARSSNLASWNLSEYKFIMYASDQPTSYYQNIATNLTKISNFVSNGGLLVAHVCDRGWSNGSWVGLQILPGNVSHVNTYLQDLTIVNTNHPITRGINGVFDIYANNPNYFDGWGYSTHGYFTGLVTNTSSIVNIAGTNSPTYIEYSYGGEGVDR